MATVFSADQAAWRGIASPVVHHIAYAGIICWEAAIAVLCWIGSARLWQNRHDAGRFDAAKDVAVIGIVAGILLWFTGFVVVGGEWFLMWQSKEWNGLQTSREFALILGFIAINRQGGSIEPDLGAPQRITDYRSDDKLKQFIRSPSSFR